MSTPLPVIPHTYRMAINWTAGGGAQTATNVIHLRWVGGVDSAAQAVACLLANTVAGQWDSMGTIAHGDNIVVTPLDGSSASLVEDISTLTAWAGQTALDVVPAVALLVKLTTAQRGRARRGRIYVPFQSETKIANGQLVSGEQATLQGAWNGWQGPMHNGADTYELVVASYDRKHAGAGAQATTVTGVHVEQILATQRRRQDRVRV